MKNNLYSIIRYLRVKQGIKLEYLAKKLGISKSHMSLLERDYDSFDGHWEMLIKLKDENNEIAIFDKAYELFDEY